MSYPRFVLIGNGFDLAHGLKTSYRDFIDWYMCSCFKEFVNNGVYNDCLLDITLLNPGTSTIFPTEPQTIQEVLDLINSTNTQKIKFNSHYFKRLVESFKNGNWIDIERNYFNTLTTFFKQAPINSSQHIVNVKLLNTHFDFLISRLTQYLDLINHQIPQCKKIFEDTRTNIYKALQLKEDSPVTFVNFNYTDMLQGLNYAYENEIIHIHGQVSNKDRNPIIFGYGDETAPEYQQIEDSGENAYLEHIKSFAYFKTNNYNKLIAGLDNEPYVVSVVGHSCGLSDRVLLNEIFEHKNCLEIDIFFHKRADGSDNYKEITQEISRHFKPHNKWMFRRKILPYNEENYIPQNIK
jgi:hypothetical protein